MKHINVASPTDINSTQVDTTIVVNKLTGLTLISLISAYSGEEFGITTLNKTIKGFRSYKLKVSEQVEIQLFVDSGGYSIIIGEVPPYLITRCIETYHYALEYSRDSFDFIFSLDIPFNAKHPSFNTRNKIEGFNRQSLTESIKVIRRHPELKEKFLFIYHFKTIEHYKIWQKLYRELDLGQHIKHRAIGGMVSLKQAAKIDFAPFIATAYQCLNDYLKSNSYGEEFRVHFLGINVKYDRFLITFLEKQFQRYVGEDIPVVFTYDTINYRVSGFHIKEVYDLVNGELLVYDLFDIPDELLQKVYRDEQFTAKMKQEIFDKQKTGKFRNSLEITPLKVYSELAVDAFFEEQIEQYKLIDLVMKSVDPFDFKAKIKDPIKQIFAPYENVFGSNTSKSVRKSLYMLQCFHDWYMTMCDDENELDYLSRDFISQIGLARLIDDTAPKKSKKISKIHERLT